MFEFFGESEARHGPRISTLCRVFCIVRLIVLVCLATFVPLRAQDASKAAAHPVYVVSNGFHTAYAIRAPDAGPLLRASARDPHAQWVMVGWGDKDYFMAGRPTAWITIKAVCWPTESALLVIPLRAPPEKIYPHSEIVLLTLSRSGSTQLRNYLERQFALDHRSRPIFLREGFSKGEAFFLGSGNFYFPKMCNWWIAEGLRHAGFPISRARSITARQLMQQVEKHGVVVEPR